MQYVAAFIFLVGLGMGVNYLMMGYMRSRLKAKANPSVDEESLPAEFREEISAQVQNLKQTVQELMDGIDEKSRQLDERQERLNQLLQLVDERLAQVSAVAPALESTDREHVKSGNQNNFQKVFELHRQGLRSTDIARNLRIGVGEVELRLGILSKVKSDAD